MVSVEVGASAKKWGHNKPHPMVEVFEKPLQVLKKKYFCEFSYIANTKHLTTENISSISLKIYRNIVSI